MPRAPLRVGKNEGWKNEKIQSKHFVLVLPAARLLVAEGTGRANVCAAKASQHSLAYCRGFRPAPRLFTPVQKFLTAPTMWPEEMYDLQTDPHEIRNLVNSTTPAHRAALKRLRRVLKAWIANSNDQGQMSEKETSRQSQD